MVRNDGIGIEKTQRMPDLQPTGRGSRYHGMIPGLDSLANQRRLAKVDPISARFPEHYCPVMPVPA